MVTDAVDVPTIGIGAGRGVRRPGPRVPRRSRDRGPDAPKFVRRYATLGAEGTRALGAYADDVRSGRFPSAAESYHLKSAAAEALGLYGSPAPLG